jgi:1-acyl-sn-glycerol-3-phosphate acyltransferase
MGLIGVIERVDWKQLQLLAAKRAAAARRRFGAYLAGRFTELVLIPFYRLGTRVIARLVWHPRVIGFDKLPKTGPALIVCNHVSYVDGFLMYASSKRPIRFLIDGDILNLPGVHYFMTLAKAISILPTRDSVTQALAEVSQALREGDLVCVFPEGTLSRTGSLGRFRPGIEWMVKRDPVPVYPIAINGLWGSVFSRKYHRFRWWPRHLRAKITLICGDPIAPEQATVNRLQREVLRMKYIAQSKE